MTGLFLLRFVTRENSVGIILGGISGVVVLRLDASQAVAQPCDLGAE
jgi:hypothetical protein